MECHHALASEVSVGQFSQELAGFGEVRRNHPAWNPSHLSDAPREVLSHALKELDTRQREEVGVLGAGRLVAVNEPMLTWLGIQCIYWYQLGDSS